MNNPVPGPPTLLHEFFVRSARLWPDRIALEIPPGIDHPDRSLTSYADLDRLSAYIARHLRKMVTRECVVAILLPRHSPLLFAAQLAVLRSGAAYTCLDPAFPDKRINEMLVDSEAVVVLSDQNGVRRITASTPVWDVTALPQVSIDAEMVWPVWLTAASLAYTIYTSGTTGRPKAVMVEHRAIVNLIASDLTEFRLTPEARVAQGSSAAYDSSVEETWLALSTGATLVVMDDETNRLGPDLIPWLRRERISVLCPPPTLLRATGCEDPQKELPDLSLLYVGGEALPQDLADRWGTPRIRLVNGYGPTECAVTALRGDMRRGEAVNIGKPVPGLSAHVLNAELEPIPDGAWGELCIGGTGLARGYWKRPDLNAEKFPAHCVFGRIYRTGDLVHRDSDGNFHYHGRIDSQVKVRGYRVELEDIEARLALFPGVRAAACTVQVDGTTSMLVAFLIAETPDSLPSPDDIKASLRDVFPEYMIPLRIGFLPQFPVTTGGKLNRAMLPVLNAESHRNIVAPRTAEEAQLAEAIRAVLELPSPVSIHDDFFDLGGDSLRAALLVSHLRKTLPGTAIAVRDIYLLRTVAALAALHRKAVHEPDAHGDAPNPARKGRHIAATSVQFLWLVVSFAFASSASWVIFFEFLPALAHRVSASTATLLALPVAFGALILYTIASVGATLLTKRILVGRYRPIRVPVWSSFYIRHWLVLHIAHAIPWQLLEGTVFYNQTLRVLGARIGKRVHIHRGVNLQRGGWDLLEIGDDVTISQEASLGLTELDDGHLVIGFVRIGAGSTLDVRSGLAPNTTLEPDAFLTALSHLPSWLTIPAGEKWDGIPARPAGLAPGVRRVTRHTPPLSPALHGVLTLLANCVADISPYLVPALLAWIVVDRTDPFTSIFLASLSVPISLLVSAVMVRLLGYSGSFTISRFSAAYIRIWFQSELLHASGEWLSGTLLWTTWLRAAGMKIGTASEFSSIIDVVPGQITVGSGCFFADGIYLGSPRIHRGTVTLAPASFGRGTFLGNHVVVPAGQHLPEDLLLGVCTTADDALMKRDGTAWFGQPPFTLPRREVIVCDRSLTHKPSHIRRWNRYFWESLRFTMHLPALLAAFAWYDVIAKAQAFTPRLQFLLLTVPAISLAAESVLCLLVLALKWLLLGRARPGTHALWSCWSSRWDYLYTAWAFFTRGTLAALEGTLLLNWYLRAAGVRLGKRVILGPGFSQVVDPDMFIVDDDATVNCILQAHTFEDRVLKLDYIHIGRGATLGENSVPLYGADIGAGAHVAPHSVVMKHEYLLPGYRYEGSPCVISPLAATGDGGNSTDLLPADRPRSSTN